MVTGWGRLSDNGKFAHVLQKVQLPLFPLQTCLNIYNNAGYGDYVSQCTVCGGGTWENEADSCQVGTLFIRIQCSIFFLCASESWVSDSGILKFPS